MATDREVSGGLVDRTKFALIYRSSWNSTADRRVVMTAVTRKDILDFCEMRGMDRPGSALSMYYIIPINR